MVMAVKYHSMSQRAFYLQKVWAKDTSQFLYTIHVFFNCAVYPHQTPLPTPPPPNEKKEITENIACHHPQPDRPNRANPRWRPHYKFWFFRPSNRLRAGYRKYSYLPQRKCN